MTGSRRCSPARAARALSPRGALTLHRVDGALSFALRAALAMALPAVPLALAGQPGQAGYAMLGSFTTTFGRNLPYAHRTRSLALVAVAMTACVGGGSALAMWAQPRQSTAGAALTVAAMAVVAGVAKLACDAARLSGLGAILLLFSFAVAANGAPTPADVLPQTALAAVGAAVAWLLAVSGWLVHPDRPQRLAVAAALRALAELWEAPGDGGAEWRLRHRATAATLRAYRCLGLAPPTAAGWHGRDEVCVRLADLSWSLLISSAPRPPEVPADLTHHLRRQVRLLVMRRHRVPPLLPELSLPSLVTPTGAEPAGEAAASPYAAELRAAALVVGRRPRGPGHRAALLVPAVRIVLGTGLAGGLGLLLGLGHGYWAAITAAAVLHSINVRTAVQRAVQRTLGTVAGLVLALGVLVARPDPVALVVVIVLLEFLLEYVVARNYGLGVVFLTPLALLMADLAAPMPTGTLIQDRALASLLGIAVGLVCGLLVVHGRAAVRAQHALVACTEAAERAERALAARAEPSLPVVQAQLAAAVVELRVADDAAAGELWQAEVDPTELAAAERRAYVLLERLAHRG
ncbi:FUSC family protein [Streptomyces sp. NPDC057555]|uniref:FUSC family protein n=1 Tax=Streptomyces sp. NPDC057555 TaxID=3346166 RepID=UPI0036C1556A